jgi:hypothetical protein
MKDPEICIILGNGPSLENVPNDLLDKFYTFGSNGIYDKYIPDFYFCANIAEAERRRSSILKLDTMKFVDASSNIECDIPLYFNAPPFSFHPKWNVNQGHTVTYVCMQFAFYYNFKTVYLLGVDHRYVSPGNPDEKIVWKGEDPNHFRKDYIKPGDSWYCPNLSMSEHYYRIALEVFQRNNRRIINLTDGTALDIFPRKDINVLTDINSL